MTALLIACLGVYGTLSYVVSLRRREVGLRLALGAGRANVIRQLVGEGLQVVGLACLGGLALSAAFTRLLSGMLFGVSPSDAIILGAVLGIVALSGPLHHLSGPRAPRGSSRCAFSATSEQRGSTGAVAQAVHLLHGAMVPLS